MLDPPAADKVIIVPPSDASTFSHTSSPISPVQSSIIAFKILFWSLHSTPSFTIINSVPYSVAHSSPPTLKTVVIVVDCDDVAVVDCDDVAVVVPELEAVDDCDVVALVDCDVVAELVAEVVADVVTEVVADDVSELVAVVERDVVAELVTVDVTVVDGDVCSHICSYENFACLCSIAALSSAIPESQPVFNVNFPPTKQPNGSYSPS